MNSQINLYQSLFHKNFFIDKFLLKNVFQCPKVQNFKIKFIINSDNYSKVDYYKFILALYLLTGQKPKILIKNSVVRGIFKKRVIGLLVNLRIYTFILYFLIFKQLAFTTFFPTLSLNSSYHLFTLFLSYKIQDDDILFQKLKISKPFQYQISLQTTSLYFSHLQTLLINLKFPYPIA